MLLGNAAKFSLRWKWMRAREWGNLSIFHITSLPHCNLSLQVFCCLLMHMNAAKISLRIWSTDRWGIFLTRHEICVSKLTSCHMHGQISEQRLLGDVLKIRFKSFYFTTCPMLYLWSQDQIQHHWLLIVSQTNYTCSFLGNRNDMKIAFLW